MKKKAIAIGLDAADPKLLEKWIAQGHLKNLNHLRQTGAYGRLNSTVNYNNIPTETSATERAWVMFGTGCLPNKTGYWTPVHYHSQSYKITHDTVNGAYNYQEYPPFYALGDRRVAAFDIPVSALSPNVNGLQILGWGGHAPHTPSHSQPPEALPETIEKYGKNPVLHKDYGSWWDKVYCDRITRGLKHSAATRSTICQELLQREPWDLFLTVFGETHSAGHDFWHLSQDNHPLYPYTSQRDHDPMLEIFQDVDRALGEIISTASEDTSLVLFSLHGMGNNVTDMCSMTFLPELLYRHSFPGQFAMAHGKLGTQPPPPFTNPRRKSWSGEVWQRRYDSNPIKRLLMPWVPSKFDKMLDAGAASNLASPYELHKKNIDLNWMPAMWYQPLWPKMKAFALPAFAAGHIRINLQGREAEGIVELDEYQTVCEEITQHLYNLKDGRTGQPMVKDVVRTRTGENVLSNDSLLPDPDLVVFWQDCPTDVVDSPEYGRIGPITYYRSGGHRPDGFLMIKGSGIEPGSHLPEATAVDIGPTILQLIGAPIPDYFDGRSVLQCLAL